MCIYYLFLSDFTLKMTKTNYRESPNWASPLLKGTMAYKQYWDYSKTLVHKSNQLKMFSVHFFTVEAKNDVLKGYLFLMILQVWLNHQNTSNTFHIFFKKKKVRIKL